MPKSTNVKDMSMDELGRVARMQLNADDDMGRTLKAEAAEEIIRRETLLKETQEKLLFPKGRPVPPLKLRLAELIYKSFNIRVDPDSPTITQIIREVNTPDNDV